MKIIKNNKKKGNNIMKIIVFILVLMPIFKGSGRKIRF
jgi:hypothetical protein